jgi:DNA (cytosine-5)-methyltransferase 1
MARPTYYEFFAGGGMARAGLGEHWSCLFANDFDPRKAAAYAVNWGDDHLRCGDVHALTAADLPGRADLAWASFPCQDLSLAGNGAGLDGARSGAFWGFAKLIEALRREGRAPRLLALENVVGLLTSRGGADFAGLCAALQKLGYRFGALTIDAANFLPQSRPRLFVIAQDRSEPIDESLVGSAHSPVWTSVALSRAKSELAMKVADDWLWWRLPPPPIRNVEFADLIEEAPSNVAWFSREETERLIAMMAPTNREKLEEARRAGGRTVGTLYRRTRRDENGERVQRAEVRFDGVAGCLRTPAGGSSRQSILIVEGAKVRARLLSGREAARLMGLPDDYRLPARYNETYHLVGDGVAVPVVRFLSEHLLLPLSRGRKAQPMAAE